MKKYAYGFPLNKKGNQYKKTLDNFWKNKINVDELISETNDIENSIIKIYKDVVDWYPTNEMTLYDKMFDMAILVGRYEPDDLNHYFKLCRGKNSLETKKWFDIDYEYVVPDFSDYRWEEPKFFYQTRFKITGENPHLIGPFTFLKLSKGIPEDKFEEFALQLAEIYKNIIGDYTTVHIDEPAFTMNLNNDEIKCIKKIYDILSKTRINTEINVFTYHGEVDWLEDLLSLPVNGIGLDYINNLNLIDFKTNKTLFIGFIDDDKLSNKQINNIKYLDKNINNLYICNRKPLYYYDDYDKILDNFNGLERVDE